MRRCVSHVGKERCRGMVAAVLFDEGDRLITDGVRVEETGVSPRLVFDVIVAARQCVGVVKTSSADDGSIELVEAALQRPGVCRPGESARHMPLAAHIASIAADLECLRDCDAALVEIAGVT